MEQGTKLHTKGRYNVGRNAQVDGNMFKFRGEGGRVGVVRISEPLAPMLNYFEYEIVCKGSRCAIGIGLGTLSYPLERMPGWNQNGIGYHADDGRLFHENGFGKAFGPTCTEGDRMGCGVNFESDVGYGYVEVFFTKNGKQIGEVSRMKRPVYGLYPLIGLHSLNEKVHYLGHWRRVSESILEPMVQGHSPSSTWLRSNGVKFLDDGLTLEYCGDGMNNQDIGIAQANFCLDKQNHYFEFDILDSGKKGWLAIGLASSVYPLHRHPGWNSESIGYHADNGHIYKERGHGEPFGPMCTEGDVMGCGIQFTSESTLEDALASAKPVSDTESEEDEVIRLSPDFRGDDDDDDDEDEDEDEDDDYYDMFDSDDDDYLPAGRLGMFNRGPNRLKLAHGSAAKNTSSNGETCTVYFTKNGEKVGETEFYIPKGGLYPVVGMLTPGEKVRVNLKPLTG